MLDYKQMYLMIFNAVTDALREMENRNYEDAALLLQKAQQMTEESFINVKDEG